MKLIKLFEYYEQILLEGKYDAMWPDYYDELSDIFQDSHELNSKKAFKRNIQWAQKHLKKQDRIVWYLRQVKLYYLRKLTNNIKKASTNITKKQTDTWTEYAEKNNIKWNSDVLKSEQNKIFQRINKDLKKMKMNVTTTNINDGNSSLPIVELQGELEHHLSLGVHKIDNYVFDNKIPSRMLITKFRDYEDEWKEKRKRTVQHDEYMDVFIQVSPNLAWFDLNSPSCSEEGGAMGHCGNSPASNNRNQTILSLREHIEGDWWKPHATFIYHKKEKSLGEMKGVFNKKPKPETHKAIVKLIMDKRIQGMHGGGYLAESNFALSDLSESERNEIIKKKPQLLSRQEYYDLVGIDPYIKKFGVEDFVKNIGLGIYIKEKGFTKDVIDGMKNEGIEFADKDTVVVQKFADTKDFIEDYGNETAQWVLKIINGDNHLEIDGGSFDSESVDYHISKEQETKIEAYTAKKYPEDWAEDEDWFKVLDNNTDDFLYEDGLQQIYFQAEQSGTEGEMFDALKSAYEDGFGDNNDIDFDLSPEEYTFDEPVMVTVSLDTIKTDVFNHYSPEDFDEFSDIITDLLANEDVKVKVHDPQYGFTGFDDESFKIEVDALIKRLK